MKYVEHVIDGSQPEIIIMRHYGSQYITGCRPTESKYDTGKFLQKENSHYPVQDKEEGYACIDLAQVYQAGNNGIYAKIDQAGSFVILFMGKPQDNDTNSQGRPGSIPGQLPC
jgi:hypothetical protein